VVFGVEYVKYVFYIKENAMTFAQKVTRTELARSTRRVLDNVQRGRAAVIEKHGQPEAAILDILDYYILRAVTQYQSESMEIDLEKGLSREAVAACQEEKDAYVLVVRYYLAETISLSRAAELLGVPALELRARFQRLGLPLRTSPKDAEEALEDADTLAGL
jgi:predicted HTH domain antitoxin